MEKNLELRVSELEKMLFLSKNVLSFDEASKFLNLSKSYLYKLTSGNLIPHYKPQGKMMVASEPGQDAGADRAGSAEVYP